VVNSKKFAPRLYSMSSIANYVGKNVVIILLLKLIDIQRKVVKEIMQNILVWSTILKYFICAKKNFPLDTLEVKETIQSFAVEPNGHKLIVISGENMRTNVTFYKMGQGQKSGKIETLKVMAQQVSTAIWSPNGQYVVLAAMKTASSPGGQLIFVDTSDMTIMLKQEHLDLSDIEWDPSGRYVTSSVNLWNAKRDHSFKIWTFQGTLIFEKNIEKLVAFHWRPRPPSLLTEENIKEVKKESNSLDTKIRIT